MDLGHGLGHLTYSTLVHPGDTWPEMWNSLTTYVPKVKKRVCPDKAFGVSLRISNSSAETLTAEPREREKLKAFLKDNNLYLYTVNAFPYGPFKNQIVKEQVYEPDWSTELRESYTKKVANILAEVAPPFVDPTIQSPPLGFKPKATPKVVQGFTRPVLSTVAHLIRIRQSTGRTVRLALEPEPYCFLETTDEALDYFKNHLYAPAAVKTVGAATGLNKSEAEKALRHHLGMVYDICHQAVEYEDIGASLQALADAGITVFKLQEAAALRVPEVTQEKVDALRRFADTVYLTQTVERKKGEKKLTRYLNLEDAFAAWDKSPSPREWRTHFHVPVFLDDLGDFKTTRFAIEDALAFHKKHKLSPQLEIETYTWDVLPAHLKTGDIVDYVCMEIDWVREQLLGKQGSAKTAAKGKA
jgi:sugar phosphate isomerase/epimerase